jgi:hypothetical protein
MVAFKKFQIGKQPARLLCVGLLAFILFAGCLSPTTDTGAPGIRALRSQRVDPSFDTTIDFYSDQVTTLSFSEVGWSRIKIAAMERLVLNVTPSNQAIPDLDSASEVGGRIYATGNFTVVSLFNEEEEPRGPNAYFFEWLGGPYSTSPSQRRTSNGSIAPANLTIDGGRNATLIVATSVPGYMLELSSLRDHEEIRSGLQVSLGPHPGLRLYAPPMKVLQGEATPVAEASRKSVWSTGPLNEVGPSISLAWGWTVEPVTGTGRARVYSDRYGFDGPPTSAAGSTQPQFNGPATTVERGSHFVNLEPMDLEMYRLLEETSLGTQDKQVGALFLTVPLQ